MNKGRWILLGFNLVLATTILVQPGQAAPAQSGDCVRECMLEWTECIQAGDWDCYWRISECLFEKCFPIWGPT